jgi:hypothetical protein
MRPSKKAATSGSRVGIQQFKICTSEFVFGRIKPTPQSLHRHNVALTDSPIRLHEDPFRSQFNENWKRLLFLVWSTKERDSMVERIEIVVIPAFGDASRSVLLAKRNLSMPS